MRSLWALLTVLLLSSSAAAEEVVLLNAPLELRAGEREWEDFPETVPRAVPWTDTFLSDGNQAEYTLKIRQQNVKERWQVAINGKSIGDLLRDENDLTIYLPIPPGTLQPLQNEYRISPTGKFTDDIRIGPLEIIPRPVREVLREATLSVVVTDEQSGQPLPCRLTVVNEQRSQQQVGSESNASLAVRPGVIYTAGGRATFGLPAGRYTVYATRGMEYSLAARNVQIGPGQVQDVALKLTHQVQTPGLVSCDTHVHTLTHSGHGDCTIQERMITLAGEQIELPVATDHNRQIDYEPMARQLHVRRYFTPVIGNEVTTGVGHFNIFPANAEVPVPDHRLTEWAPLFGSIYASPGVEAVILNHARDIHAGYRPFDPKNHLALLGENRQGWELRANAMEVINSGAQQTDMLQLFHDWMALLNAGRRITPVASSDSHDVARFIVGQGRTYIQADDTDPGSINITEAVENFVQGKVNVSLGLLTTIRVNEQYGPGDLAVPQAPGTAGFTVQVQVHGPDWIEAETVRLYLNGRLMETRTIPKPQRLRAGLKWEETFALPGLIQWVEYGRDVSHSLKTTDAHVVAIATGPGVTEPYWPIARPYQPASIHWKPQMLGASGAVFLDGDQDGRFTSAAEYAQRWVDAEPEFVQSRQRWFEQAPRQRDENDITFAQKIEDLDRHPPEVALHAWRLLNRNGAWSLAQPQLTFESQRYPAPEAGGNWYIYLIIRPFSGRFNNARTGAQRYLNAWVAAGKPDWDARPNPAPGP